MENQLLAVQELATQETGLGNFRNIVAYASAHWDKLKWGLFGGRRNAAEQEKIVGAILASMNRNQCFEVSLTLEPDIGCDLVNNTGALRNLVECKDVVPLEKGTKVSLSLPLFFRISEKAARFMSNEGPLLPSSLVNNKGSLLTLEGH